MSQPCSYEELAQRVAELEQAQAQSAQLARQNIRWRRVVTALVVVASVCLLSGGAADDPLEIKTGRIAVVDEEGRERIVLGFDQFHKDSEDTVPGLYVFDKEGQRRAMLGGDDKLAGLWVADDGKTRVSLTSSPGKFAGFGVFAEPGKPDRGQIGVYYSDDGNSMFTMNDRNGTTRIGMGLFDRGKPALSLNNANGEPLFSQGEP